MVYIPVYEYTFSVLLLYLRYITGGRQIPCVGVSAMHVFFFISRRLITGCIQQYFMYSRGAAVVMVQYIHDEPCTMCRIGNSRSRANEVQGAMYHAACEAG